MPALDVQQQTIDRFVARLWQHVRLRALGADQKVFDDSAKQVRLALKGLDPHEQYQAIGESLAAHILNYAVLQYSRQHCITCMQFAKCPNTDAGPCEKYERDMLAYQSGRALLAEAVYRLDGVYGIDAQQILSIVCRFLDEMAGETDQRGQT